MTDPTPVAAPSTAQLVAALASGLLPLAGPYGIAASALAPAVMQLYDTITTHPTANVSVADLAKIVLGDNVAELAKLTTDVNAMPG